MQSHIPSTHMSGQIEVRMIRQIDRRRFRRGRLELHGKLVVVGQLKADAGQHRTRITLEAVRIHMAHHQPLAVVQQHSVPIEFVEANEAAVQMIAGYVLRQRVRLAVQLETSAGDAIADPANGRPKVGIRSAQVAVHIVETERNIGAVALRIGHADRRDRRTVRYHLNLHTIIAIAESESFHCDVVLCARLLRDSEGVFNNFHTRHFC